MDTKRKLRYCNGRYLSGFEPIFVHRFAMLVQRCNVHIVIVFANDFWLEN